MPKSIKSKQLGGFNIPPEIQNLLSGIDFSNLNFGNLSTVGNLIQPGGNTYQDQVDAFRADPNAEDLDTFDDNLKPGLQRRIARRLRKGKGLTNRQQRKLNESIDASAINQEAGVQDVRNTSIGNFGQAVNSAFAQDNPDLIAESFGQGLANIGAQQGLGTAPELLETMNSQYGGADQLFNFISGLTDFQYGGKLAATMQKLGYSDGSPFEVMDKIRIKGNQIDMSNTGKRLLLIPDKGEPREVEPYSGVHVFEGASEILEVPLGKKGGKKWKKKGYQEGGLIMPAWADKVNQSTRDSVIQDKQTDYYANRPQIIVTDNRETDVVTGNKVKSRLSAKADLQTVTDLISAAVAQGLDPYTVLAIAHQETLLAPHGDTEANPLHLIGGAFVDETTDPIANSVSFLKEKFARAAQLGKTSEADVIQAFNGYGKLRAGTEGGGNKFYGIDVSKEPIDMNKNPVYGKRVIDIRENIIKANPEIRKLVEAAIPQSVKQPLPVGKSTTQFTVTSKQQGGPAGPLPVQLEVDEMIVTPALDIIDTASKEKHKDMKKDDVTDILRPEDYVFSADPKMKMTRRRLEKMSFGYTAMKYKEGDKPQMPTEITAADILDDGEDEISIAEYVRRVRKMYPTVDKEDVMARQTNQYNKESRLPYLAVAVYENERQRTKGTDEEMAPFEPAFINEFAEQKIPGDTMKYGGKVLKKKRTSNYQLGGVIAQGVQGLLQIGDALIGVPRRRKLGEKALNEDNAAINALAGTQQGFNALTTGAQLAGTVLQDPTVLAPQYDTTQLDASIRRTPRSMFDYAAGRLAAGNKNYLDTLVANTGSLSEAVNLYTPAAAAASSATADLGFKEAQGNIQLENAYRNAKQRISEAQVSADTAAGNQTRANSNQLIANAANTTAAGVGRSGDIESNRQNARRTNRMNYWQNRIGANQQTWQGLASGAGSIAGAFYNASALGIGQPQAVGAGTQGSNAGIGLNMNSPGVSGVVTQPYQGLLPPDGFTLGRDAQGNLIVIPAANQYGGILPIN